MTAMHLTGRRLQLGRVNHGGVRESESPKRDVNPWCRHVMAVAPALSCFVDTHVLTEKVKR